MIKSKKKQFEQHLYHDIENDEEKEKYLESALPLIGHIVMYFNSLEQSLNSIICECITDTTDSFGLIILHKMTFSTKVDLFKRFSDDFHTSLEINYDDYNKLIGNLFEAGRLRNLVVHADWENTDDDGYTYVNLKIKKGNMEQEYAQFSEDSLEKIIELIIDIQENLYEYWEWRNEVLYRD